jgi:hypothetical protein
MTEGESRVQQILESHVGPELSYQGPGVEISRGSESYSPKVDFLVKQRDRLIAVEVQDSGSRKHRIGDLINAYYNGDIGIVIAAGKNKQICKRLLEYLRANSLVGEEMLILTPQEFDTWLSTQ